MDLKPENMMINKNPDEVNHDELIIKIIDFGLMSKTNSQSNAGTPTYMHPELLNVDY